MGKVDNNAAVEILRNAGCSENVIEHCLTVCRLATSIADEVNIHIDKSLLKKGAVLHDLGRSRTHGLNHITEGVHLAQELKLGQDIERIIERHIGAGVTSKEAAALGLPAKDHMPETPEEKIIAYADNLTRGKKTVSFEESLRMFKEKLGSDNPAISRMIRLHHEIEGWKKHHRKGDSSDHPAIKYREISSPSNQQVKDLLNLTSERTHEEPKIFLAEGPHLVEAALASPRVILKKVFVSSAFLEKMENKTEKITSGLETKNIEIILASDRVIKKLSATLNPQGIVGVAEMSPSSLDKISPRKNAFLIVADAVQDPGNLGALIRTADAAGADALVILPGSCDPYSSKALRATAGSLFNLPVVQTDADTFIRWSAEKGIRIIGAEVNAEKNIYEASLCGPICLVFGNEGQGLSSTVKKALAETVAVPIPGHAESLNVTAAAAICIFETVRQRQEFVMPEVFNLASRKH